MCDSRSCPSPGAGIFARERKPWLRLPFHLRYGRLMGGNVGDVFADDDPEYAGDAAAEVDAEVVEFVPEDPRKVPPDQGDSGNADPPGGGD